MKRGNKGILKFIVLFILLSILSNCSTISEINLLYSLPNPNHRLRGVKIYILFKDKRERKDILSDKAKKVLKNFSGTLTFHLKRYGDTAFRIGPFSLKEIFSESLKFLVENNGAQVVRAGKTDTGLEISVNRFFLDFKERKWKVDIAFTVTFIKTEKVSSSQKIEGSGERLRLFGTKQASELISEVFTELLNRIDLSPIQS